MAWAEYPASQGAMVRRERGKMGTNYYWHERKPCEKCGRPFEPLHIGKSSGGWCFTLHIIPERGINDLPDWERLWKRKGYILDEYGDRVDPKMMSKIIRNREWKGGEANTKEWYSHNYAEPGPNGLMRHVLGHSCVKHGDGTWDCVEGEFL